MDKDKKIRVRIAPSPTGLFHIGTARTALFNYLFAKKNKGSFILRIEDTDKERSEKKFEKDIMDGLKWLGLEWDELYYQSQRVKTHEEYLKKLIDSGQAYKKEIIWFKNPNKKVAFQDLIRGRVEVDSSVLGDFSLAKDLKTPLYNFAAVVDDHEMGISHVIRGEDHITNTPKQILVYEALGWQPPQFAHLPLILGPDRSKLSKRHSATSLTEYKNQGYLPEALVNFMALLGWSPQSANIPDQEIFSLEELGKEFSLEKIQKGGAIFNIEKLNWFNGHYIRQMDINKLAELCIPYLISNKLIKPNFKMKQDPPAYGAYFLEQKYINAATKKEISTEKIKQIISLEKERMRKLSEIGETTKFFFKALKYKPGLLAWKETKKEEILKSLKTSQLILCDVKDNDFKSLKLKEILVAEAEKFGSGDKGKLLWPLRVALSGREKSPGPFEIAEILGKEETLKRLSQAEKLLKK